MKITPVRALLVAGAACALALPSRAQIVELRATINAAQETTTSTSSATGSAVMLYNVATNKFDLMVTISNLANLATASHVHEAAAGVSGSVVTDLGGEAVYSRSGNTLTATFFNVTHGGDAKKLIKGEAYYNLHSAQFPAGEVRGQLLPRPVRLVSKFTVAQEQAAFPNVNLSGLNDFGGAIMHYDPAAHTVRLRLSIFNFNNPFSNSHFHVGAPGVSGPVAVALGTNANAGNYSSANGHISGSADISMGTADPIALLTGGLYLNFHSTTFTGGELRGQVVVSNEIPSSRFANVSVRGFVGTGEQVLIQGLVINGPDPIRVLIAAKGPSLSAFGISGPLANPRLTVYDSAGRAIANNDDVGTVATGSELASIPGVPSNTSESALVLVLPPGNYTAIVSSASGTGVALLEASEIRTQQGPNAAVADAGGEIVAAKAAPANSARAASSDKTTPEFCAVPLVVATAAR